MGRTINNKNNAEAGSVVKVMTAFHTPTTPEDALPPALDFTMKMLDALDREVINKRAVVLATHTRVKPGHGSGDGTVLALVDEDLYFDATYIEDEATRTWQMALPLYEELIGDTLVPTLAMMSFIASSGLDWDDFLVAAARFFSAVTSAKMKVTRLERGASGLVTARFMPL